MIWIPNDMIQGWDIADNWQVWWSDDYQQQISLRFLPTSFLISWLWYQGWGEEFSCFCSMSSTWW